MIMFARKNSPDVRFSRFQEGWEELPFNDVFLPLKNRSHSRAELTFVAGEVENIHYGDILVKYRSVVDCNVEELPFVIGGRRRDFAATLLADGDILIADAAEDESVGKAVELSGTGGRSVIAGLHTIACRPSRSFSEGYLGHYLNAPAYRHQLFPLMQGTKVLSLSRTNLARTAIHTPSLSEQAEIGNLFENLDALIGLQQSKLKKLRQIKNAMLSKMFPGQGAEVPDVRFPGFKDCWEELPFGQVFQPIKNWSHSRAELSLATGAVATIHYGDILMKYGAVVDRRIEEMPFVTGMGPSDFKPNLLMSGDILFADAAEDESVGKAVELAGAEGQAVVAGLHTIACRPSRTFSRGYLGYYLNASAYRRQLLPLMQGTKVLSISRASLGQTLVQVPSLPEQAKIGEFFEHLDTLIGLQIAKNEKLDQIKRSLLSKMFV